MEWHWTKRLCLIPSAILLILALLLLIISATQTTNDMRFMYFFSAFQLATFSPIPFVFWEIGAGVYRRVSFSAKEGLLRRWMLLLGMDADRFASTV
jgi:hypothetical protein